MARRPTKSGGYTKALRLLKRKKRKGKRKTAMHNIVSVFSEGARKYKSWTSGNHQRQKTKKNNVN